jgi:hypothetical protein
MANGPQLRSHPAPVAYAGTAVTFNLSEGEIFRYNFGAANCTATFVNPNQGEENFLVLKQDSVGSRTMTWPTGILWKGGVAPTLTTTASKTDVVHIVYDGANYYGWADLNFS